MRRNRRSGNSREFVNSIMNNVFMTGGRQTTFEEAFCDQPLENPFSGSPHLSRDTQEDLSKRLAKFQQAPESRGRTTASDLSNTGIEDQFHAEQSRILQKIASPIQIPRSLRNSVRGRSLCLLIQRIQLLGGDEEVRAHHAL